MKRPFVVLTILFAAWWSWGADTVAVRGAKILTVTRGEIEQGTILIQGGKIQTLGPSVAIPEGAEVVEAAGQVATPGLIDSHSHLGLGPSGGVTEDNEMTDPWTPQLRIIDSIHPEGMAPDRNAFRRAIAEGVTTIIARPGSGNVIGGQSAALKLAGKTVDDMVLVFPLDMKMAMGKKSSYASKGQFPMTRMGTAAVVRQAMAAALDYRQALNRYEQKRKTDPAATPPKRDMKAEAMLKVLDKEIPVHIHCSRVDDIMTAVRLAEELGFARLSLGHAAEAYKVADELAKRGVVVVVGPEMIPFDEDNRPVNLADYLVRHGVQVHIMTDADVVQEEFLRHQAAIAVKYGMDPNEALKAITIRPAQWMGLESRLGSLEPGKDADIVLFDGDPFDVQTRVRKVFINGEMVYDVDTNE